MKMVSALLSLSLLSASAFAQDLPSPNFRFSVSSDKPSSISQIVGICDGPKSSESFACSIIRVSLVKGDALQRKIMGGGENQCFLNITSDGEKILFKKTGDYTWTASSEPSVLCGNVDSYKLEGIKDGFFLKLTISSKYTDFSLPVCEQEKAMGETTTVYSTSAASLDCDGVKTGTNPGLF